MRFDRTDARLLEQSGAIRGYATVLDPTRLGLNVRACVQVKLERHTDENIDQFRRELADIEEVISCHATTGAYDFLLQVVASDLEACSRDVDLRASIKHTLTRS